MPCPYLGYLSGASTPIRVVSQSFYQKFEALKPVKSRRAQI